MTLDALRALAATIVRLPDGQYRWVLGEARRRKRALRTGKAVKKVSRRGSVRRLTLDVRTSLAVRDRDGWRCRNTSSFFRCPNRGRVFRRPGAGDLEVGETSGLEHMHVVPRRYKATRYLVENGLSGCVPCHHYFENHRREWEAFCRMEIGSDEYERLWGLARGGTKKVPVE